MTKFCYGCAAPLEPVDGMDSEVQFDGALQVSFDGGYGMYIEDKWADTGAQMFDGAATVNIIICKDCTEYLCAVVPWARAALQLKHPYNPKEDNGH